MSANLERPPDEGAEYALHGGLDISAVETEALTLISLPLGARLILRCRKDWRTATVSAITLEKITLSVASPTGHTYRVRRPPDEPLSFDGSIPIIGEGCWRSGLARYDMRW